MSESFETPDGTERLQVNLEDDVRSFLISRLAGNQMDPDKRQDLRKLGINVRRLSKPSYIKIHSGSDAPADQNPMRCEIGAEGVMVHEDEELVHLAFKCGDPEHQMHYTTYLPETVIQLALAMESVWEGSIIGALMQQAIKTGRARPLSELTGEDEDDEEDKDEEDEDEELDIDPDYLDDDDDDDIVF